MRTVINHDILRTYVFLTVPSVHIIGVGVLLAADSQSTSKSGYRASIWDQILSCSSFFRLTITLFFFLGAFSDEKTGL
jgi:hypothetical protein